MPTEHPSGDKRFKLLDAAMKKHQYRADALLEVLHKAQELFGYLTDDLLLYVAHSLKQPPSRVYGVATFYHFFMFAPRGNHTCMICLGTACYVKGAAQVLADAEKKLDIHAGQTRPDGKVTLQSARCLGSCGLAPVGVFDGKVVGNLSTEKSQDCMKGWLDGTR